MNAINWLASAVQVLRPDGRWDLLTLGLAFVTLVYVGVALAISFRGDRAARRAVAHAADPKAERGFVRPASLV